MKFKVLFASLALALGASSAHAAIATGANGSGELFLSVWDPVAAQSYSQDLGVDLAQFLNNSNGSGFNSNASWSVNLDATVWGNFFNAANAGSVVYNVAAAKLDNASFNALSQDYGYLTSFKTSNLPNPPDVNNSTSQIGIAGGNIALKANYYNANPTDAAIWSSATQAYFTSAWGSDFGGAAPANQDNTGSFGGTTLAMFHGLAPTLGTDPDSGDPTIVDRWVVLPGTFQLTGTQLSYTVGSAAVPVPAAVWLFGSAMAGLLGFSRRRNNA